MKKILVTGGNGYKGTLLVNRLLAMGYRVKSIDTNWFGDYLLNHPNLEKVIKDIRNISKSDFKDVSTIIHLANIANDPAVELNPILSWEVNVLASQRIASFALDSGVENIIYASSGSVYGISDKEKVTEKIDLCPISEYNKTKMVAERVFLSYQNDMKIFCIRPATVCGVSPRMRLDVAVNILTYSALKNNLIKVFGGNQIRPNIHIDDICGIYEFFLLNANNIPSGCFNAGFENISIMDIAKRVKNQIPSCNIQVEESNDPRSYRQCSDLLLSLGYKPEKTVNDAINDIIKAFKEGTLNDSKMAYTVKRLKELSIR
ncbi:SDR family oxidoreductase [Prochlorococcus marinus XMU1411]|uniref:NAD-dependent epimerase/dehydratase family protein n=1 Tax=Prochlorococcus marinus TaxID=1219 RepID=UPI001AD9E9DB|nr:SDR family oxidoreductase [Prochlorococcus marinus]MBO8244240.1 SDR family oxidoreductase [Prochlorococcus marinus XMU1411]MBW3055326.1 NAD-dependent epimerase/dehydratase [Prochlorococcus marinus str. MU1411]MCR8537068.1 SDR family oxidoreductase [Prochlorococcus marinus CUG1430]